MSASYEEAIRLGRQALGIAAELGLDELRAHVLNTVGIARVRSGHAAGVADVERSIELALALNAVPDVLRGYNNLAGAFSDLGDLRRSREAAQQGLQAAERFGEWIPAEAIRSNLTWLLLEDGDWDGALELSDELITGFGAAGSRSVHRLSAFRTRAWIRLGRGDRTGTLADARAGVEYARQTDHPPALAGSLSVLAEILLETGSRDEAERVAEEFLATLRTNARPVTSAALMLSELGRGRDALALLQRLPRTRWREAAELVIRGNLAEAAAVVAETGARFAEAFMRVKAGERLVADGRHGEAADQLERALAFWRSVGATRYIRECEKLLAASDA